MRLFSRRLNVFQNAHPHYKVCDRIMSSSDELDAEWTPELELYFKETAEKSQSLSILHRRAERYFTHRKVALELPTIVLSALVGFCSVGSGYMFNGNQNLSSITLGVGSLFVSVIQTCGSYFAWSKRAEGHRISSIQYGKQHRFIAIEMSLSTNHRINPSAMLKMVRNDYDRLAEVSPALPDESIVYFEKRYGKYSISKPPEVNGLEEVRIYSAKPITIVPPVSPDP
jgi:hypothetical protein